MATSHVFGTRTPSRSRTGQKRTWWPQGPAQPPVTSGSVLLRVGSLHSGSILIPKLPVGLKVPDAGRVVEPLRRGSTDWPSTPRWVTTVVVEVDALACQKKVAVLPCVWYAASCRTVTGWA